MQFDNIPKNLILVQEECAEVIQAISKMQRFGRLSEYNGVSNEERLQTELAQLECVIDLLTMSMAWDKACLAPHYQDKLDKLVEWY